jgi:hypothetical protein
MDQQTQQPIGQNGIPTQPPEGAKNGAKNKTPVVVMAVIVLLILAGIVWQATQSSGITAPSQDVSGQQPIAISQSAISWTPLASSVLLKTTAPIPYYNDPIQVFKIGDINSGEYKGDVLAFAAPKSSIAVGGSEIFSYIYFISNSAGDPIAWNRAFIHDPDTRCYDSAGVQGCERFYYTEEAIGLTNSLQKPLDSFPPELGTIDHLTSVTSRTRFSVPFRGELSPYTAVTNDVVQVDKTASGFPILKKTNTVSPGASVPSSVSAFPSVSYFMLLPFGKAVPISPEPDFMDANDVPGLKWTVGTTSVASYRYGQYAYGWEDCYDGISAVQFNAALVRTGTTVNGGPVFEVDPQKYPQVYSCLHEKTKRYVYDEATQKGSYVDTVNYSDFIVSHPMFFWRHPLGDLVAFVRSDVVPAAEKAKPVIYLYPEKEERVHVEVAPIGGLLTTDPAYGDGWNVDASPSGSLHDLNSGKIYPYLFWEGGKDGVVVTPKQGFVVSRGEVASMLEEKLSAYGLNRKERADFLEFWVPKLSHAPYYFITFISRSEIDRVSPMKITPAPQTVIRLLMDYKPLEKPITVSSLDIVPTRRVGFTVVEWGGIIRD